ncbi:MAG: DUF4124 domain-containing protein [Proteobacteria bacterium]|nr:DUF4124 domain-containing protein [Pseudomonadota bacterium]
MKLAWKLLLAVLVIGMLLPFTLLKDDTGSAILNFSNLKWPDWRKAVGNLSQAVMSRDAEAESADTIYQWVDAEGNMHFSNTPPLEGIEFRVKNFDPDLNVIQSVNTKTDEAEVTVEGTPKKEMITTEDVGSPYSVDGIKKLFEDVHNVEKLLKQRLQKQEAALG